MAVISVTSQTHSYVGVCGFPALEIELSKERCELRLNAAQRLRITMQEQNHVHHREALTHQRKHISKETYHTKRKSESHQTTEHINALMRILMLRFIYGNKLLGVSQLKMRSITVALY